MFEWIFQIFSPPPIWPPPTLFDYIFWWLIFIGFIFAIYILYKLVTFLLKKLSATKKISLNLLNVIKIVFRLFIIVFICLLFIAMSLRLIPGGLPSEVAFIVSAITGAIITFSSITILQNFIAGLYILFTRPYKIDDLIRIGDQEGIVEEVSLNHTKLRRASGARHLISNLNVINSKIINFTIRTDKMEKEDDINLKKLKNLFLKKELTRYWFTLELPKENPVKVKQALKEISEKYGEILNYTPEYSIRTIHYKIVFDIIMITDDPGKILKYKSKFVKDLFLKIFEE